MKKSIYLLLIIGVLLCSCATHSFYFPDRDVDVKANMDLVNQTLWETSDAVDILFDESLSVEERTRLYLERMKEINERWEK